MVSPFSFPPIRVCVIVPVADSDSVFLTLCLYKKSFKSRYFWFAELDAVDFGFVALAAVTFF